MDFRKEVVTGKVNQLLRWVWRGFEETSGLVRELGNKYQNVSQGILILNIQGFSMTRHGCLRCKHPLIHHDMTMRIFPCPVCPELNVIVTLVAN
jgi:hypothetical protein